jgi:hypothetical protein
MTNHQRAKSRKVPNWLAKKWRVGDAENNGVFDFKNRLVDGPQENAFAYVAVWIKSPKPLNDLLSEPNLPKLSFNYGSDDGCELWLNGELLAKKERHGPLDPNMFSQNPLLLKLSWNQLVTKVVQESGEWKFAGNLPAPTSVFYQNLNLQRRNREVRSSNDKPKTKQRWKY